MAARTVLPGAHGSGESRWAGRPVLAWSVRTTIVAVPVLASLLTAFVVSRLVPAPPSTSGRVLWAVLVLATSTLVIWRTDRWLRRLLPLAALLEMSVLFPGEAPSRFAVARHTGSTKRLEELVERARATEVQNEPARAAERILALVAALRAHDKHTRGHSERVRVYTDLIADELGLTRGDKDRLRWAALLHDIGKLAVPTTILNKPGKPSRTEWEVLEAHPDEGAKLAAPLLPWLGEWAPVIAQHHERYDGTGYPRRLKGSEICLGARIVAVADAFEVMTAARSYKRAMPRAAALRELARCSGSQFDPMVVRALIQVSAPKLQRAMGPLSWLGQLPIIGTAPSLAGAGIASQTAVTLTTVAMSSAAGLTPLVPVDQPARLDLARASSASSAAASAGPSSPTAKPGAGWGAGGKYGGRPPTPPGQAKKADKAHGKPSKPPKHDKSPKPVKSPRPAKPSKAPRSQGTAKPTTPTPRATNATKPPKPTSTPRPGRSSDPTAPPRKPVGGS